MKLKLAGLVFFMMPFLHGCGSDATLVAENGEAQEQPTSGDSDDPTGDDGAVDVPDGGTKISYSQMQKYLNIYCQQCHAGSSFMTSEKGLRASSSKTRIANGSMPTPGAKQLPSNVKTEMLGFF